jgi:hypothetical protein
MLFSALLVYRYWRQVISGTRVFAPTWSCCIFLGESVFVVFFGCRLVLFICYICRWQFFLDMISGVDCRVLTVDKRLQLVPFRRGVCCRLLVLIGGSVADP